MDDMNVKEEVRCVYYNFQMDELVKVEVLSKELARL